MATEDPSPLSDRGQDEALRRELPVRAAVGRASAVAHPICEALLCHQCLDLQLSFFDPVCPGCWSLAQDPGTTVGQLFAVLRQWVPQVQRSILALGQEIMKRDFHVDDKDGLTDMTLLHCAARAGCQGIGEPSQAQQLVCLLLEAGADPLLSCRWSDMTALHYAVYFDAASVVRLLLNATQFRDLESRCSQFDGGTSLHIAAESCCLESARCLLELGADSASRNERGLSPAACVPDPTEPAAKATAARLKQLLWPRPTHRDRPPQHAPQSYQGVPGKVLLASHGLRLGDRVCVGDAKVGTLRFYGATQFASGALAGIELDEDVGKHDGTVEGVVYFQCPPQHGIFVPLSKVSKFGISPRPSTPKSALAVDHGKIDVSHVSPKVDTGRHRRSSVVSEPDVITVGDRVQLAGQVPRHGIVRYSGLTQFAAGWWYGIELDRPDGKNNGSVDGVRYFTCASLHGVFAHPWKVTRCGEVSEDLSESAASDSANH